jgi:NhaP-type Na+/H+ or K+/H+ antiporter
MLMWMNISGDLILYVFLPPLIYEGSAHTNVYKFSKHFVSAVVLAGPGVIIQTALIGCVAKNIFPYNWGWTESFLFGGILSATDPVAVIALLKELGYIPDLRVLIEAESILNDGSAIVVYELCYLILTEPHRSVGDHVITAFKLSLGGPAIGIVFCLATMLLLSQLDNPLLETTVTITAAYLCFFVAQGSVEVSGVLAVMTLGVLFSTYGQSVVSHQVQEYIYCCQC